MSVGLAVVRFEVGADVVGNSVGLAIWLAVVGPAEGADVVGISVGMAVV
jgi:hypothetical protein